MDPVAAGDGAVDVGEEGKVESVADREALLGRRVVVADADPGGARAVNSAERSRKWQLSAVQPGVIAAG